MNRLTAYWREQRLQKKFRDGAESLEALVEQQGAYLLFILVVGIHVFIFRDYLFYNKAFFFYGFACDSMTQFFPFYYFWLDRIQTLSLAPWSFQMDLGANIHTLLINLNPFDLLLLLGNKDNFVELIPYILLLKFVTAGMFFYAFLRRLHSTAVIALIGALLFTFSGYMVINSHWLHYPNYALLLAILLYLFERWLQTGRWTALALVLGLLAVKTELQFAQLAVFFVVYGTFRLIYANRFSWRDYGLFLLKSITVYAAGLLMSSYALLPSLSTVSSSDRVGKAVGEMSLLTKLGAMLTGDDLTAFRVMLGRFFSNDFWGSWNSYRGIGNYFEGPTLYMGMLTPVVVSALLWRFRDSVRKGYVFLALCAVIPLVFPGLRQMLNAFVSVTFKYQTMYISALLIILAVLGLNDILRQGRKSVVPLLVMLLAWLSALAFLPLVDYDLPGNGRPDLAIRHQVLVMGGVYALCLLAGMAKPSTPRRLLPWLLLVCVVVEIALWGRISVNRNDGAVDMGMVERGEFYFDPDVKEALSFLRERDDSVYRVGRDFFSGGLNDALVQDYFGVTGYMGASGGLVDFYQHLDVVGKSRRVSSYRYGLEGRTALHSLLNVKYFLSERHKPLPGYRYMMSFGKVHVYENINSLPLGFVYHNRIDKKRFAAYSKERKDEILLHAFVSDNEYAGIAELNAAPEWLPMIPLDYAAEHKPASLGQEEVTTRAAVAEAEQVSPTAPVADPAVAHLRDQAWELREFQESRLAGTARLAQPGMLFWSIPFDHGWRVRVDGRDVETEMINYGFLGVPLEKGEHEVALRFEPRYRTLGLIVSVFSLLLVLLVRRYKPEISLLPASRDSKSESSSNNLGAAG